jgi:hypothetical protein
VLERPFGAALREAVRGRGLTLDRIRFHLARRGLHVGISSLSDWQHGRSMPASMKSLRVVAALEEILELPPGELSGRLSTPRRRPAPDGLDESGSAVEPLVQALTDTSDDFDVLARSHRLFVDHRRLGSVLRTHTVTQARCDGLDRYVMRYFGDPGCRIDEVRFTRLTNCHLGRVLRRPDPQAPALVAELIFDRPLAAGETWVFDREIVDNTGQPCTDIRHGFRQPARQFVLEVEFDSAVSPVDIYAFAEEGCATGRKHIQDLTLSAHRTTHVVASDVRSGLLGIAWSWADDGAGTAA